MPHFSLSRGRQIALLAVATAFLNFPGMTLAAPQEAVDNTASTDEPAAIPAADDAEDSRGLVQRFNDALEPVNEWFGNMNGHIASVIFFPVPVGPAKVVAEAPAPVDDPVATDTPDDEAEAAPEKQPSWLQKLNRSIESQYRTMPLAVIILLVGATFFTIRMGFINIRGFVHAIKVTAGKYDDPEDEGEVTHFQALTAALSATVGLGNIAGVAIAICLGGPGATLWMVLAGFIGMTSKFVECTLGQLYREERPDGRIMGGAMFYLSRGLPEVGLGPLGKVLGVMFAVLCVGGSFAGGNSFQVNMSLGAVGEVWPFLAPPQNPGDADYRWVYGLGMSVVTGMVIIGGIRRIASAAEKIVPAMCGIYVAAAIVILIKNFDSLPAAVSLIFSDAFSGKAVAGGMVGVLVVGFQRAAFSNEAGVGSAAIAHAAAKTDHPVREGVVAMLGPFIDTVIICTMTALVIVVTGAWNPETSLEFKQQIEGGNGAALTSVAMDSEISGFKYVLGVAVILFAFSTMISWSYYGERCWAYLFGDGTSMLYRSIFLVFTFLGSILSSTNVLEFGDLMIFGMAIPNIIGVVLLSGKVRKHLDEYWVKVKSGEFDREVETRAAAETPSDS
ncbi:alanine/glycine:cation symporter family protein [Fuerstiella marisgermanici]|uniref:Amino-acid carrier protein AlsT n=1 Tax=Fuerstiella marisgermanici TaxID=1891926 RepID=A0A1P8WDJ3_9PLAN|nr:alanine/glycine:cation symporter family protein [Fuerstiella marisgermanici]APZ92148.1 Amino-acid carrier protein AlsT [Fuerstiella marisgermanici]